MHAFILLATAALLTLTSADQAPRGNDISTVFTTVTLTAFTVIDKTVPAATITGTATIDDGVTIINDGESLYMIGTAGNQFRGGLSGTNIVDDVTVVNGQIVGTATATTTGDDDRNSITSSGGAGTPTATSTRDDDGNSITSSGGSNTGSSRSRSLAGPSAATASVSTTPTGGAMRAMTAAEVLGLLGLGAMAALVV